LLLFAANVASILFVTIITFSIIGLKKKSFSEIRLKATLITVAVLIVIANPLLTILEHQSLEIRAYPTAKKILEFQFKNYSPSITVDTIEIVTQKNGSLLIEAVIWLPSNLAINYVQQKELVSALETALHKPINLKLKIQHNISIISEADERKATIKNKLTDIFYQNINNLLHVSVDSLELLQDENELWQIQSVIRSDSEENVPENLPETIKQQVLVEMHIPISVQIEVIPRKTLNSQDSQ